MVKEEQTPPAGLWKQIFQAIKDGSFTRKRKPYGIDFEIFRKLNPHLIKQEEMKGNKIDIIDFPLWDEYIKKFEQDRTSGSPLNKININIINSMKKNRTSPGRKKAVKAVKGPIILLSDLERINQLRTDIEAVERITTRERDIERKDFSVGCMASNEITDIVYKFERRQNRTRIRFLDKLLSEKKAEFSRLVEE